MKSNIYKREELLHLTHRDIESALNELTDRYQYFFMQVDGSYDLPNPDGHTHQILRLLGEVLIKREQQKFNAFLTKD